MIITIPDSQQNEQQQKPNNFHDDKKKTMTKERYPNQTSRSSSNIRQKGHLRTISCPVELLQTSRPKASSFLYRSKSDVLDTEKRVSFGRIEVRNYPIILGDHPDCSDGPPLTIDWEYQETNDVTVDAYENAKPAPTPREMLSLDDNYRSDLLRRSGFSHADLMETTLRIQKIQRQRNRTVAMMPFSRVGEALSKRPSLFRRKKNNKYHAMASQTR